MDINSIISELIIATEEEKAAAARIKAYKAMILDYAKDRDFFDTADYNVLIKSTESFRLDTKSLYTDFPDIKETYGKTVVSRSVVPVVKSSANKKTA